MNPYQGRRLGPAGSPQSLRLVMITIIVWSLLCAANVCILASPACRTSLSPEVQEHVAVLSMLGRLSAVMERRAGISSGQTRLLPGRILLSVSRPDPIGRTLRISLSAATERTIPCWETRRTAKIFIDDPLPSSNVHTFELCVIPE